MLAVQRKYDQLKHMLGKNNPDFSWEVMNLEIQVQQAEQLEMQDLTRLIQLYMTAVEVLQNAGDQRYVHFNNKLHALMLKKSVVEKLHVLTTGQAAEVQTLQLIKQKQLQNKKSQYELQLYLQKQAYNISSIKDFLKKEEKQTIKRQSNIKNNVMVQHQNLQRRISNRKLRSSSKNKPQSTQKQPPEKIVYKQFAQYTSSNQSREKKGKLKRDNDD